VNNNTHGFTRVTRRVHDRDAQGTLRGERPGGSEYINLALVARIVDAGTAGSVIVFQDLDGWDARYRHALDVYESPAEILAGLEAPPALPDSATLCDCGIDRADYNDDCPRCDPRTEAAL
jgi:hypothetical protein